MPDERPLAEDLVSFLADPDGLRPKEPLGAEEAARQTLALYEKGGREGATFDLRFGDMSGLPLYSVGLLPDLFPLPEQGRDVDRRDLLAFIRGNQGLLSRPAHGVGLWYDAEADQVFMDVVILLLDEESATSLGAEYNQKAIFDLQAGEVIWLEGTGEPIG